VLSVAIFLNGFREALLFSIGLASARDRFTAHSKLVSAVILRGPPDLWWALYFGGRCGRFDLVGAMAALIWWPLRLGGRSNLWWALYFGGRCGRYGRFNLVAAVIWWPL